MNSKYSIGDLVGHKNAPTLQFRIIDVLTGIPEQLGNYAYAYMQVWEQDDSIAGAFSSPHDSIYIEEDLFLIRRATAYELTKLLKEATTQVDYLETIVTQLKSRLANSQPESAYNQACGEEQFQLFKLKNKHSVIGYPYLARNNTSKKVIFIDKSHIDISAVHKYDEPTIVDDYEAVEECISVDMPFLNQLIESVIETTDYTLTAYFNESKEIVLTYGRDKSYCEKHLVTGANTQADEIISVIHQILNKIQL